MTRLKPATVAFAAVALATLTACPPGPGATPAPTPTPSPAFLPPSIPPGGAYSDQGIEVFGGRLFVEVKNEAGEAVPGAVVKVYGPTLAVGDVNDKGQLTLAPLAEGAGYRAIVEAPGYATLQVGNIEIKKETTVSERPRLSRGAELSGRVTAGGEPVAGAVVSDGLNSTLTDSQGAYTLGGVTPGSVTLTASKPRHQTASRSVNVSAGGAAKVDLGLNPGGAVAYFDGTVAPGVGLDRFGTLQQRLRDQGWSLSEQPPGSEGVWILTSPGATLANDQIERLVTFVAQGGKVVILGEWGGFSGFNHASANRLAHAFGLHFNPDLLRDPSERHPEWLTVRNFLQSHPATSGVSALTLYQACSLFAIAPMGTLAQSGKGAFRVQANAMTGPHSVVAGGPYRGGKAIVVGDASAFTDADTDGNGKANILEADNARLFTQLLDW